MSLHLCVRNPTRKVAAAMRHELDSMASAFNEVHRELSTMNDGIDSVLKEGGLYTTVWLHILH